MTELAIVPEMAQSKTIKRKNTIKKYLYIYCMLAVPIVHFLVFYVYVNFDSFMLAFIDQHTGLWSFDNFQLVFNDIGMGAASGLLSNIKNTILYFLQGLLSNILSFVFAYFIYKKVLLHKIFRFVFVIPMIVSSVVLVAIYSNILSTGGPVAVIYSFFTGKDAPAFLYDERYATGCILFFSLWTGLGMNIILFSGAMNRIPQSVIEYAKLDGVGEMKEMVFIVMPIIAPTFGTIMLLSCISVFGASGPILLFTDGMYGTSTISYWMYANVVLQSQYNYAAAFGLILTLASLPIFFLMRFLVKKLPDDIEF